METEAVSKFVDTLFPTHCVKREEVEHEATDSVSFTEDEVIDAAKAMKCNKAPGPDGIAAIEPSLLLLNRYNARLKEVVFPEIWKKQKLVLICNRQHGFRTGRSTTEAIQDVIASIEHAEAGNRYSKRLLLLATLDIRNAFNSLGWGDVIEDFKTKFKIPNNLLKMIDKNGKSGKIPRSAIR